MYEAFFMAIHDDQYQSFSLVNFQHIYLPRHY